MGVGGLRRHHAGTRVSACSRFQLAGALALHAGGAEVALPTSRRARAVLATSRCTPPARAGGARACGPTCSTVHPQGLRAALSELRRALGPAAGHLVATRETVGLDGPGLAVDTRALDAALTAGDTAGAIEACRAPILDGSDKDSAHDARQAHAQRLAEALKRVAAATADPAAAIRLAREQSRSIRSPRGRPGGSRAARRRRRPGHRARRRRATRRAPAQRPRRRRRRARRARSSTRSAHPATARRTAARAPAHRTPGVRRPPRRARALRPRGPACRRTATGASWCSPASRA